MKQDVMTVVISKLVQSGIDEADALLMLVDLFIYLKNEEVITINSDLKNLN